jgi:hypothetical protein
MESSTTESQGMELMIAPPGLSRRTLLARAGALGASALALPALACGLNGIGERSLAPTATPSTGTVTSGRYHIHWQKTARTTPEVTAADLAALAQNYGNALNADYVTEQQFLQQDVQALGQVSDLYSKSFSAALSKVGVDVAQLEAELEAFGKLTEPLAIDAAKKTLDAKYLPFYPKAYEAAGMDRGAIVNGLSQQIRPRVTDQTQLIPTLSEQQLGWGWTLQPIQSPQPPSPCNTPRIYYPPYQFFADTSLDTTQGIPPTPVPNEISLFTSLITEHDSSRIVGTRNYSTGTAVVIWLDGTATNVHVEAEIVILTYRTEAIALPLGYASAEALVTLGLQDDHNTLAEDRVSVARSIAAVCTWDIKKPISGTADILITLSVDHALPSNYYPTGTLLTAYVDLETWVGCAWGIASSYISCIVQNFRTYTTCAS